MNKLKRVPIAIIWFVFTVFAFTFIDYTWITDTFARFMFIVVVVAGGLISSAMNATLKFWKYKP